MYLNARVYVEEPLLLLVWDLALYVNSVEPGE